MHFLSILLIGILEGAEIDLFVPSFPELQSVFALTPFMVQFTLGVNLASQCLMSLVVGNLSDRYGRKPVILMGLLVFILGSIVCVFAGAYWQLLLGRFLQGIGISGPAVLLYVVISDGYPLEKQQQLMGILNGSITIGMACAPVVGSYVNLYFGWQGNFILLLLLGVLCALLASVYIPQIASKSVISNSLKEYIPVFRSRKTLYYVAAVCLLLQSYWIFIGMAPIYFMESLSVPLSEFGFYQGSMAAIFSATSFATGYFLKRYGQKSCFYFSVATFFIFIVAALSLMIFKVENPLLIIIPMQFLAVGTILSVNILWPLSLQALPDAKGRISAVSVSSRLILTAISLQIVSFFYDGTFLAMGIAMCLFTIVGLWTCMKLIYEYRVFDLAKAKQI